MNQAVSPAIATLCSEEMEAVRNLLRTSATALEMPLRGLVQAQVERAQPEVHAAVVLATAVLPTEAPELRAQRIHLAAALEMLYIALNVHKLLLNEQTEPADKPLLGGTILAGDYCFSQSANLAVETDNPQVVEIFSQALKEASEGTLRQLLGDESTTFDASQSLCHSGALAGLTLVGENEETQGSALFALVDALVNLTRTAKPLPASEAVLLDDLPEPRRSRFIYFFESLNPQL